MVVVLSEECYDFILNWFSWKQDNLSNNKLANLYFLMSDFNITLEWELFVQWKVIFAIVISLEGVVISCLLIAESGDAPGWVLRQCIFTCLE